MGKYYGHILLTVVLMYASGTYAQYVRPVLELPGPAKSQLVKYFPYSSVQVIDNRTDTTKIYTPETGSYLPQGITFNQPVAIVIKKYIEEVIQTSQKGDAELLINIEQFGIPNLVNKLKYFKRSGAISNYPVRKYLQFRATAWYKNEQDNYNKLLTIERDQYYGGYEYIARATRQLLNDCILMIAYLAPNTTLNKKGLSRRARRVQYLLNNTAMVQLANDENNIPFEQININVRDRWKGYPVIKENRMTRGIVYLFDDFKQSRIAPAAVEMEFSVKDSLYHLAQGKDTLVHNKKHWGLCDGVNWYIKLADSSYVKLTRTNDTFGFYIPANLPDMYALLSIEENHIQQVSSYSSPGGGSGNILAALIAAIISNTLDKSITNAANRSMVNRLTAEGLRHNYRYCTLNMDNGDILYNDK